MAEIKNNKTFDAKIYVDIEKTMRDKQISVKPKFISYDDGMFVCPRCGCCHHYELGAHLEFVHYCDNCGQALDWSEEVDD